MNVNISIDSCPLIVKKGTTILQAARQHSIDIPTLCDYPGLPAHGSCRLCIVEIEGRQNTPTACTTPVEEGMVIRTSSPRVQALRADLLGMLLADHPACCLFCTEKSHCDECMVTVRKAGVTTGCRSCSQDGQCALQLIAEKIGLAQVDYPVRYRMLPVRKDDPFFDRDYNLCVLCGRCIRACDERHFASILAYTVRGSETVVGTAFNRTHYDAGCSFCGACIEVCPTGALSEKTRKWDGKPEGETATTCPLCSIGCQVRLLHKNHSVIGSLPDRQSGADTLCVKGRFGITELVNHPTRLRRPQQAAGQGWLSISWDETIRLAAEKLAACPPDQFEMVISTHCTNEDLYVAQKFARQVMQSDRIHAAASGSDRDGLEAVFKLLSRSQPLSTLSEAQAILCLGLDGKYSQSVVEVALHRASIRGARIVTVNSQAHSLSQYADVWLRPIPGKEPDLIQALIDLTGKSSTLPQDTSQIGRTARILQETANPVVVVGPSFIDHPDRRQLLEVVDRLARQLGAGVIALPEQGNLAGALLLGEPGHGAFADLQRPGVLYLIGESIQASLPAQASVIYQNIYPPTPGRKADLILPAAAFSEVEGTVFDHTGCVRAIRQAVPPPGEALPTWEILSRIAQKMGRQDFDYTCAADIRAEIAGYVKGYQAGQIVDWPSLMDAAWLPARSLQPDQTGAVAGGDDRQAVAHTYMGFPLAQWVAGLRQLYPDESGQAYV